ncbi:MAG: hypothetical protein J6Z23_07810 [Lachnospiraceae bacterium]|nr:hypothetical protein [Lachnospiraceae bacterium]
MASDEFRTREERLDALRSSVITLDTSDGAAEEGEKRSWIGIFGTVIAFIALAAALVCAGLYFYHNYEYTTYTLDYDEPAGGMSSGQVYAFSAGCLVIGADSVTYFVRGTQMWSTPLSLSSPVIAIEGDFFSMYDSGGYQVYIFGTSGLISTVRVSRRIYGMDISASGVTAVFTESSESAYISYFDRFGSKIAVEVKTVLSSNGYPVDLSVSPNGQRLAVISYSTANGIGESRLVLYDFGKGRESNGYVIGRFTDYYDTDTFLLSCDFKDDDHLVAVGDNMLSFFTIPSRGDPERTMLPLRENLRSVLSMDGRPVLITEEEGKFICTLYEMTGEVYNSFELPGKYTVITAKNGRVMVADRNEIWLYNASGRLRYHGILVDAPAGVAFSGKDSLLFSTGTRIEHITFR